MSFFYLEDEFCCFSPEQSHLNNSNTDVSFTMANSNSFLSPNEIFPISIRKQIFGKFSYFIMKWCVVYTHKNRRGGSNAYTQRTNIV